MFDVNKSAAPLIADVALFVGAEKDVITSDIAEGADVFVVDVEENGGARVAVIAAAKADAAALAD